MDITVSFIFGLVLGYVMMYLRHISYIRATNKKLEAILNSLHNKRID